MKHAINAFLGESQRGLHYELACGPTVIIPAGTEMTENVPINVGKDRGAWCPTCYPERTVSTIADDGGAESTLHSDLGGLESDGDTLAEDMGEETILNEEVVEDG